MPRSASRPRSAMTPNRWARASQPTVRRQPHWRPISRLAQFSRSRLPPGLPRQRPSAIPQAASAAVSQAAPGAVQAAIVAADARKAKSDNLAARQADAGTHADDLNSSVKTASTPQGDGKPAPAIGEADKQAATHPHDEVPANTHHAAGETPPPIMTDAQATAPKIAGDIVQQAALTPPSQDVSPAPANLATPRSAGRASGDGSA